MIGPGPNLLVRGVNWLGDAVMTTPALLRLRQAHPHTRITLLSHEKLAGLWTHHPAINAVIEFSGRDNPWTLSRRLRPYKFSAALLLPHSPRAALEAWLAGVPNRIGYGGQGRDWLLTCPVPRAAESLPMRPRSIAEIRRLIVGPAAAPPAYPRAAHHIHHYLRLVHQLGANSLPLAPEITVATEELEAVAARFALEKFRGASRSLLGLVPGAEFGPAKRWPADRFAAVATAVAKQAPVCWLILGTKADAPIAESIVARLQQTSKAASRPVAVNLAGATSLRELCALLKLCQVVLTNDTGSMHLAAALGQKVVALFGSTAPELTGPGSGDDPRHRVVRSMVPCAPCFRRECPIDFRCMLRISVEQVVTEVLGALRD